MGTIANASMLATKEVLMKQDVSSSVPVFIPWETMLSKAPPHDWFANITGNDTSLGNINIPWGNIAMNIIKIYLHPLAQAPT